VLAVKTFGSLLYEARTRKDWDRAKLANQVGREEDDISLYEADIRLPQPKTVALIEQALDLETGCLMDARQEQINRKRLARSARHILSYSGSRELTKSEEDQVRLLIEQVLGEAPENEADPESD
jgi:transcriptional regulator with XRE-family HTH domain